MLLDQGRFETDVLGSDRPVLVDFFRTSCPPCRQLAPILDKVAEDGYPVCKVNVQDLPDLATRYRVNAVPTLLIIQGGEEVARFVGIQPEPALRAALDQAGAV